MPPRRPAPIAAALLALLVVACGTPLGRQRPTVTPTLPAGACQNASASLSLTAPATAVRRGEEVTLTVTLANTGDCLLGLPQYRLYQEPRDGAGFLAPEMPRPVLHTLGVAPGQTDQATFVLRAARAGRATLTASASFEVHIGYPGSASWRMVSSEPLVLTVEP